MKSTTEKICEVLTIVIIVGFVVIVPIHFWIHNDRMMQTNVETK